jgi:hypothetical protein
VRALTHILRGTLNRTVFAGLLLVLALVAFWIIAASLGRSVTVVGLIEYFRGNVANNAAAETHEEIKPRPFRRLIGLHSLRAALMLAAILGFMGAVILVSVASDRVASASTVSGSFSQAGPLPALVSFLVFPLSGLICLVWWELNWLLSLAGIFAVRDGVDALGAIASAVTFCRDRSGAIFAVSTWTGVAHLVAFGAATTAASLPLAFIHVASARVVIAAVILAALAYFGVADWLYTARLAGYLCIAEIPDALRVPSPLPPTPPPPTPSPDSQLGVSAPVQTTIDRDETILSDLPNFAVET